MRHSRLAVNGGAALSWAGVMSLVAAAWDGVPDDLEERRLFGFFLGAAITLTLLSVASHYITDPRTAYRLGWDARGRHDELGDGAEVVRMDEQRRA